jgi:CheY-like chemotaxis protein
MLTEQVDLLIQDIARPRMNGFDLYARMKTDEQLLHIPVVICSGHPESCKEFQHRYPEVSSVLEKPFEVPRLLDAVRRALP